jgi:hypothetical protein
MLQIIPVDNLPPFTHTAWRSILDVRDRESLTTTCDEPFIQGSTVEMYVMEYSSKYVIG